MPWREWGAGPGGTSTLLAPLAALYGGVVAARGVLYDRGWLVTHRLPVPVISVGNLTVGGTGKTPMVAMVARLLAAAGARPAIVSRGYGGRRQRGARVVSAGRGPVLGADEAGDEPVMLARLLETVPVIVSARRRDGGAVAMSRFGADCVILDDGFQHRALARDLDLLLIDGVDPFGNGRLLPAGPLREPIGAIARAGAIAIMRAGGAPGGSLERLLAGRARGAPIFHARSRPVALVGPDGELAPLERLAGARVVCFAGIARPERFFADVQAAGGRVAASLPFPDHHRFSGADLDRVAVAAAGARADMVVTTEKDAARMAGGPGPLERLCALRVETLVEEAEAFTSLLRRAVS